MVLDKLSFPNQNVQGVHGKFSFSAEKSWQLSFLYSSHKLVSSVALARQLDIRIFRDFARNCKISNGFYLTKTKKLYHNFRTVLPFKNHAKSHTFEWLYVIVKDWRGMHYQFGTTERENLPHRFSIWNICNTVKELILRKIFFEVQTSSAWNHVASLLVIMR